MRNLLITVGVAVLLTACVGMTDPTETVVRADRVADVAAVDGSAGHEGDKGTD